MRKPGNEGGIASEKKPVECDLRLSRGSLVGQGVILITAGQVNCSKASDNDGQNEEVAIIV